MNKQITASNRKAYHEYNILDKYEAGIELFGTEVKSLREAQANLKESYVVIRKNQAWVSGMHINPYSNTGHEGHDPIRNRRLLLNKREILKICFESVRIHIKAIGFEGFVLNGVNN